MGLTAPKTPLLYVVLAGGDNFDFYQHAFGKLAHGYGRTGGVGRGEHAGIHFVHRAEVGHVGQEHGGLHHVVDCEAGSFENGAHIGERLLCLGFDAFGNLAGGRIDGYLAGSIYERACVDGLAVGADCAGSGGGCYYFFNFLLVLGNVYDVDIANKHGIGLLGEVLGEADRYFVHSSEI